MTNTISPVLPQRSGDQFGLSHEVTINAPLPSEQVYDRSFGEGAAPYNENNNSINRTNYNAPASVDTSIYGTNTDALTDPKLGVMPNGVPPTNTQTYKSKLEKFGL